MVKTSFKWSYQGQQVYVVVMEASDSPMSDSADEFGETLTITKEKMNPVYEMQTNSSDSPCSKVNPRHAFFMKDIVSKFCRS